MGEGPDYQAAWRRYHDALSWMQGNRELTHYLGWDLVDIANDLIDRAYPGLRKGHTPSPATAIVHIAADGEVDYQVTEGARLLIVDERAPGDRVYGVTSRITAADVTALIGSDEVGSQHDDRHPVLAARVIAAQEGRPHLRLVDDGEGRTDA